MSERRCGVEEDLLESDMKGRRSSHRKHTRYFSFFLFMLLVLTILGIFLFSLYHNTPAAPGQDQAGPGRGIGQ
jgi:hypothetical protein